MINITNNTFNVLKESCRKMSRNVAKVKIREQSKVNAWQVHSYGDVEELQYGKTRIPQIQDPNELLISVEAASINPIDVLMLGFKGHGGALFLSKIEVVASYPINRPLILGGYGRTLFQIPRRCEMELPLTLGRDFCGTVIFKGQTVGNTFNVGDKVYGFIPLHKQGSFSEAVVANKAHVCKQPQQLDAVESTSLVYATMTAWSALYVFGKMLFTEAKGTRVLILGASGGVGTVAVQLLKSQGCLVYGSCSADAIPLVQSLGADCVFNYKDSDYLKNVEAEGYYHIILDCAKFGYENVPKSWKYGTYITLNSPLLLNTDKFGLVGGLLQSASSFLSHNLKPPGDQRRLVWGFFVPSGSGLRFVHRLISEEKIRPVIHKEFNFENLPVAFQELKKGHMRGKVVVKL